MRLPLEPRGSGQVCESRVPSVDRERDRRRHYRAAEPVAPGSLSAVRRLLSPFAGFQPFQNGGFHTLDPITNARLQLPHPLEKCPVVRAQVLASFLLRRSPVGFALELPNVRLISGASLGVLVPRI